jgi:copper chaperone CopZ
MKKSIIINKLIVEGEFYRRTLSFNTGLNIINGERTSGKSLVLRLIDYCLGKSGTIDLNVQKELAQYCDRIYLEIIINEDIFTLKRELRNGHTIISIYFDSFEKIELYTPKVINIKDLSKFMLDKLEIIEYKLTKHKRHDTKKEIETVSFRDMMRYIYINQHILGTNNFLENSNKTKSYKNSPAFKVLHNLIEADIDNITLKKVETENEIDELKKEIKGLQSYLGDKEAEDYSLLLDRKLELEHKITQYEDDKEDLIKKIKEKQSIDNQTYSKINTKVIVFLNEINALERRKQELHISSAAKQLLLSEYQRELEEITATKEAMYNITINKHELNCPLCKSKIINEFKNQGTSTSTSFIKQTEQQLKNKLSMLAEIISNESEEITLLDKKLRDIRQQKDIFDKALDEYSKNVQVPFLPEIDTINNILTQYKSRKEYIIELIRVHNKITEKYNIIRYLETVLEDLNKKLKSLKVDEDEKEQLINFISNTYRDILEKFYFDVDSSHTYVDYNDFMPYYNGASVFKHESGGLLQCMQIAYLSSILLKKKDNSELSHPGFLMLDTLSKYLGTNNDGLNNKISDPRVYEEIYKVLIELSESFQIIVVDNTPPKIGKDYIKYTFFSNEKGLIDLDENELG